MGTRAGIGIVYMALDVGDVRIGVALSRSGVIAEPLKTIERTGRKQTLNAIESVVSEYGVTDCVIGLPLLEGGAEGEQAEKTRAFARSLARRLPKLQIHFHDERYSSGEAMEIIGAKGAGRVDQVAAAVFLQAFLDGAGQDEKKKANMEEPDADENCQ